MAQPLATGGLRGGFSVLDITFADGIGAVLSPDLHWGARALMAAPRRMQPGPSVKAHPLLAECIGEVEVDFGRSKAGRGDSPILYGTSYSFPVMNGACKLSKPKFSVRDVV